MEARMTSPVFVIPDAMKALQSLHASVADCGVSRQLLELVHLRASQINGCGVCADLHPRLAKTLGESDERLFAGAAWRDTA